MSCRAGWTSRWMKTNTTFLLSVFLDPPTHKSMAFSSLCLMTWFWAESGHFNPQESSSWAGFAPYTINIYWAPAMPSLLFTLSYVVESWTQFLPWRSCKLPEKAGCMHETVIVELYIEERVGWKSSLSR